MIASRTFLLLLIALVTLLIITALLRATERPFRKLEEIAYKETGAYAAWLGGTAAMLAISYLPAIQVLLEALDLIYGSLSMANTPLNVKKCFTAALTASCIILLIATACFWCWIILAGFITRPVLGKAALQEEMALNNISYFICRYTIIILCMLVLMPFYLVVLRYFLPAVNTPFYR
ncbi:hypothetical protein [Sediminibacterium ginsengisoli]|uniref:Uncharacterized protein n=1 Tax=Sediminibacterium ginsengisoli TaxID=413434 RepID=A0A1T4M723_9BACT|nr:hypothetical protein [Sediminibacterium ginsengisoli]SJZ62712.1 hypothetical protein SAMN04488132_103213 [Sediminibacterium ginsengisoli]